MKLIGLTEKGEVVHWEWECWIGLPRKQQIARYAQPMARVATVYVDPWKPDTAPVPNAEENQQDWDSRRLPPKDQAWLSRKAFLAAPELAARMALVGSTPWYGS